jgi:hypothetical protein
MSISVYMFLLIITYIGSYAYNYHLHVHSICSQWQWLFSTLFVIFLLLLSRRLHRCCDRVSNSGGAKLEPCHVG